MLLSPGKRREEKNTNWREKNCFGTQLAPRDHIWLLKVENAAIIRGGRERAEQNGYLQNGGARCIHPLMHKSAKIDTCARHRIKRNKKRQPRSTPARKESGRRDLCKRAKQKRNNNGLHPRVINISSICRV